MDRLLARLERRFGDLHIPNLTLWLVGLQALALALELAKPGSLDRMVLDPSLVLNKGEYWRLFSYVFLPPSTSPFWALVGLMWLHTVGSALEQQWGGFKYQAFWFVGLVLTSACAMITMAPATNVFLLMSLLLAFATLWPDFEFMLFFLVRMKVKWLALLDACLIGFMVVSSDGWGRLIPIIAVGNYLLFFAPQLWELLRGRARQAERGRAMAAHKRAVEESVPSRRQCKACGVNDANRDAEFRVCTCDKCGGKPTDFCMDHIRAH